MIKIRGATEHNLDHVDANIGPGLTVVTGVSGSGKTSLVFDTLYHEARRRFLDLFATGSVSRRLAPAQVETITGLGPAVALGQDLLNRNPNSNLATASGLHPFLRVLFARFGNRTCSRCQTPMALTSGDELVHRLVNLARSGPVEIVVPLVKQVQGSHQTLLSLLLNELGPESVLVDGKPLQEAGDRESNSARGRMNLDPEQPHDITLKVAFLPSGAVLHQVRGAAAAAQSFGAETLGAIQEGRERFYSIAPVCPSCGTWFEDLEPIHFRQRCTICEGDGCQKCWGTGLPPLAAAVQWRSRRFTELLAQSVGETAQIFQQAVVPVGAERLFDEIVRRLEALDSVGLGYLSLDRSSPTLSRGEAQRVRLSLALTSRLQDLLHVLDEPTIGQHAADIRRVLPALRNLSGPVVYVEHDQQAAAFADRAIDLGPGAGNQGGRLLYSGSAAGLWTADTPTGRFFSRRERIRRLKSRPVPESFLILRSVAKRTLTGFDCSIPLERLTVVTGVSGSGKSTLVEDVLVASLKAGKAIGCHEVDGPGLKPILVDQKPIGRNPRSTPATYTKLSDQVRDIYAANGGLSVSHYSFNRPEGACPVCNGMGAVEVMLRYLPSTWIRCGACDGRRFSDEVLSSRVDFGRGSLSVADFYDLSVVEALALLEGSDLVSQSIRPKVIRHLQALIEVGLGYLPLGQPSPTLSGGEAQRVKLAKHLGRRSLTGYLLVLDEPTTGLHPQDVGLLMQVLDRLVRSGGTVVLVEHHLSLIRAADWIIDLGPGAGPDGGNLLYAGPPSGVLQVSSSATGNALANEHLIEPKSTWEEKPVSATDDHILIRRASVHNLKDVTVRIPKRKLTVVSGVSGSGKSSLVTNVLETEARRRFLETLSLYERQGIKEGPDTAVEEVTGLGVALTIGPDRHLSDQRATVGTATEIAHHLAILLAWNGRIRCPECNRDMVRETLGRQSASGGGVGWHCLGCDVRRPPVDPRHFSAQTYAAACLECHGVGSLQRPNPDKLIIRPDKPLCQGAMYSPGFFPKGFLCKPYNSGYDLVKALAQRFGFDPEQTPWQEMPTEARKAFLFGDPEPMEVHFESRSQSYWRTMPFPGFYGWIRDWDTGGTYTDTVACPSCKGAKLRPEYLAVTLAGYNSHQLNQMPLNKLAVMMAEVASERVDVVGEARGSAGRNNEPGITGRLIQASMATIRDRITFLVKVGLGYLHLGRPAHSLSAGEAQRVKIAGLLGSGLTSLTILLDEPSRGLHPSEVGALGNVLKRIRDQGNTVVVVEHDPVLIMGADYLIDMGPGAGEQGGRVVAQGTPAEVANSTGSESVTGPWIKGRKEISPPNERRQPHKWLTIQGPQANNLSGEDVRIPLGLLVGICGVSGSGKSTLIIDTLGRALAPRKHTTSVAKEPIDPGLHDAIVGAPGRVVQIDQSKAGVVSPAAYLGLNGPLRKMYAQCATAKALGLPGQAFSQKCSACHGRGVTKIDMGFLPAVRTPCETCLGTGYTPETWEVRLQGYSLPELSNLSIDHVFELFKETETIARPLAAARSVGLGYLVLRQPGFSLSGGEAQRLKIALELSRRQRDGTLYLLDEPTVGQHLQDVSRLTAVLDNLVEAGHSVVVVEHHTHLLACCDWLLELGPGGGPEGGRIVAAGTPEEIASGKSPTSSYIGQLLGEIR